jgi:hypothetical protein
MRSETERKKMLVDTINEYKFSDEMKQNINEEIEEEKNVS